MKKLLARRNGTRPSSRGVIAALALTAVIGLAAWPAFADEDYGNRGHHEEYRGDPRDRARYSDNDPRGYRAYDYYGSERYVYAPPPVVYEPYPPSPIEFIFQIR